MRMKKTGIALGLLLVLLFSYAVFFVQSHKPDYDFHIQSDAVSAPVEVVFDDMAVPHIYAETESDAMFALGYVHAWERLWQMDLLRRAGGGELSALLGEEMISNDRYLRTLGMREAADRVRSFTVICMALTRVQSQSSRLPTALTFSTNLITSWPGPPVPWKLWMMVLSFLSWSTKDSASNSAS